jgi:hypothetical protein
MKLPQRMGLLLLGTWLIANGAIPLLGIGSYALTTILALVAIAAGVLLILDR